MYCRKENNEESEVKWYDCLIRCLKDVLECLKKIPNRLEQAQWGNTHLENLLVLLEYIRLLVVRLPPIALPAYDVVTDCIAASDHFK